MALAMAFPEFPVTTIKMDRETSRLKDFVSMAGPDLICVSTGLASQSLLKRMEREATYRYEKLTVPDEAAANVLFANGTLLHPSVEFWPKSNEVSLSHILVKILVPVFLTFRSLFALTTGLRGEDNLRKTAGVTSPHRPEEDHRSFSSVYPCQKVPSHQEIVNSH
jgi:hypothetical protein